MCAEKVSVNWFLLENQLCSATGSSQSSSAPPPRPMYDEGVRLHRQSHQSRQKLHRNKKNSGSCLRGRSLSSSQIYKIIKQARARKNTDDQCHLNPKKTVRMANLIAYVAAAIDDDRQIDTRSLAATHGVCLRTICRRLCWVPKLVSQVQKEECLRISNNFVAAVERSGLSILDNIVTMDETMISYYTPETKRMSNEWTLKGKPGPLKAKVQASHSKQMVFAFFDSCSLIYMHIALGAPPSMGPTSWMSWESSGGTCG
jgi:hypothetical protein